MFSLGELMPDAQNAIVHLASALVAAPPHYAIGRLSDAEFVGGWSLGSMGLSRHDDDIYVGTSLFDRSQAFVEIHPSPEVGLIRYSVGDATHRRSRIYITVSDAGELGWDAAHSIIALHAIRAGNTRPERWAQTCTAHETEILLIKSQLEREYGMVS